MGRKGFILCVCQGTCPSFKKMDIFNATDEAVEAIKGMVAQAA